MKDFTRADVLDLLRGQDVEDGTFADRAIGLIDQWVGRGDGCAVYRNEDLGSQALGHLKFVSFGSDACQLPVPVPPARLPDIGGDINWRYVLYGTYKPDA